MFPRMLSILLIALAMLMAPVVTRDGRAMAMPASHHGEMTDAGHCDEQPVKDNGKSDGKSCCVAMCTAIAVAPTTPIEPHALASSAERPAIDLFHRSYLAELPTPPPRLA